MLGTPNKSSFDVPSLDIALVLIVLRDVIGDAISGILALLPRRNLSESVSAQRPMSAVPRLLRRSRALTALTHYVLGSDLPECQI